MSVGRPTVEIMTESRDCFAWPARAAPDGGGTDDGTDGSGPDGSGPDGSTDGSGTDDGADHGVLADRHARLVDLDFTVVDVETTGWAPEDAAITEIGAVRVRGGQLVAEFTSLVNPGTPVPASITELTGISDQMLRTAPPVARVLPGLLAFARGSVLAAHNAPFDLRFLTAASAGMGLAWPGFEVLDTVRLARHLMATPEEVPDRKLATLAQFFATPVLPSHRALDDARCTAVVLGQLLGRLADREGVTTLDELACWLAARDAADEAARTAGGTAAATDGTTAAHGGTAGRAADGTAGGMAATVLGRLLRALRRTRR
jgi:DNA polymerase III epsilon subunit family exonuclease